jgi:CheY-like chemotaxis protein
MNARSGVVAVGMRARVPDDPGLRIAAALYFELGAGSEKAPETCDRLIAGVDRAGHGTAVAFLLVPGSGRPTLARRSSRGKKVSQISSTGVRQISPRPNIDELGLAFSPVWAEIESSSGRVRVGMVEDVQRTLVSRPPACLLIGIPVTCHAHSGIRWHPDYMALRLLIVDDNEHFLEVARSTLERDGLDVVGTATTAADAERQAEELGPDVVLVDLNLGGDSGFDLTRRLAELRTNDSRILLISTRDEEDFIDLIKASPAIGFLSKSDFSAGAIRELLSANGS